MTQTIRLETDARGVARLTLDRPNKHNALNDAMIGELSDAAARLVADPAVRCVILAANGPTFCAGGDLAWMTAQAEADRATRIVAATRLAGMLQALDELPIPLIGVIAGNAYGGGVGLAAVCDIVIATPAATFMLSETRLGLIPATIAPFVMRRIGGTALRRFALTAARFSAAEAAAIGLVSEVQPETALETTVTRHIDQTLACAPGAIADAKRLFRRLAAGEVTQDGTVAALADRWEADEARQGIAAFFAKAKPPWAP
jgi:methylglutaconyl-CoA hydratase